MYLVFEKITIFLWCESLNHCINTALTPSHCAHNPERIFRFRERAMRMFQCAIDLDSLWAILPVE